MTLVYIAIALAPFGLACVLALCLCVVAGRSDGAVEREYRARHARELDLALLAQAEQNLAIKRRMRDAC